MLSIHRDTYVPITCYSDKHENKINAAAAKGTSCAIQTVENYLGVKIDYYAKINFTGLVDLVDTLGGVEVDVPYALCEQDSKRRIGSHTVYIEQGYQTLNGEQALAFARNRKQNENYCPAKYTKVYRSVELRGKNQQTIILAVLEKLKQFKDITKLYALLDVISDNVDTNMDRDQILSFYNVAKDMMLKSNSDEVIQIQKLNIIGEGQMIYDESLKLVLWNYIPQRQSLQLVKDAMQ
jgi:LCP family protein required for cell wall assembly